VQVSKEEGSETMKKMNLSLTIAFAAIIAVMPTIAFAAPHHAAPTVAIYVDIWDAVVIETGPVGGNVDLNGTLTMSVTLSGTAPYDIVWVHDGTVISGETDESYTITAASANDAGEYWVECRNVVNPAIPAGMYSSVTSAHATVTVGGALTATLSSNPVATAGIVAVNPESSINFAVSVSGGTAPYTVIWQKGGVEIGGAGDQTTFTLANIAEAMEGTYTASVTDSASPAATISTNAVVVSVNDPVVFTDDPDNICVDLGQAASFTVATTGTPEISYQWYQNGIAVGSDSNTFSIASVAEADAGTIYCVATNIVGSVTSATATLTINGLLSVTFTSEPVAVDENGGKWVHIAPAGGPEPNLVTITAVVTGGVEPYHYEWTLDGTPIGAPDEASITVEEATNDDEGLYSVNVTDSNP